MSRLINAYDLTTFQYYISIFYGNSLHIEKAILAHGRLVGERWCGGFLVKNKDGSHIPPQKYTYFYTHPNSGEVRIAHGQHELDFPEIPDSVDKNPVVLNDWLEEMRNE